MKRYKYKCSLHIHIISLFTILILLCGSLVGWYSYSQLSKSILASGNRIFSERAQQVELKIKQESEQLTSVINILNASELVSLPSLSEKLKHIALAKALLTSVSRLKSLYIASENGDFFLLRKLNGPTLIDIYKAPEKSKYMLTTVESNIAIHRFYDADLVLLQQKTILNYAFSAKKRPWYITAINSSRQITTDAYQFYTSGKLGITQSFHNKTYNNVIAIDYTLNSVSEMLKKFKSNPYSERIIFNDAGYILSSQNKSDLPSTDGIYTKLVAISESKKAIIPYLIDNFKYAKKNVVFKFAGQEWLASIKPITAGGNLYLAQAVPIDELLVKAYQLRHKTLVITFLIILLTLPLAWVFSKLLTSPISKLTDDLKLIKDFDFSDSTHCKSYITEIDELIKVTATMKETISHFQDLSSSLVGKQSFTELLKKITHETLLLSKADGAIVLLFDKEKQLKTHYATFKTLTEEQNKELTNNLKTIQFSDHQLQQILEKQKNNNFSLKQTDQFGLCIKKQLNNVKDLHCNITKITNRSNKIIGILVVIHKENNTNMAGKQSFIQAIASFSALAIEAQILLTEQKQLLESFIQLMADAIDNKSPYTGGHCARVPELTKMLSQAACDDTDGVYKNFELSEEQWEELHIAAWLHDCGKIITPEYVVDKATKLETVYNRIHEIRMRFELLKEQANSQYWKSLADGEDSKSSEAKRDLLLKILDNEFTFVAECNIGGEFMSEDKITKLNEISKRTWLRTLDDKLGLSIQEIKHYANIPVELPVSEPLLANKRHHIIDRVKAELTEPGNEWGFNMTAPEYQFNRGEIYNLSIKRGTLTDEERFIINGHMVHTIVMLSKLPFPNHLKDVPTIAGGHHEKMNGRGYPRAVKASTLPLTARIMVVADIFEALTASDRPYKEGKKLSEAIKIMANMVENEHIDKDVFSLFLTSGIYLQYAKKFLPKEQIDEIDLNNYQQQ